MLTVKIENTIIKLKQYFSFIVNFVMDVQFIKKQITKQIS